MPYILRAFGAPLFLSTTITLPVVVSPHTMSPPTDAYKGTGAMVPVYQSLAPWAINGQTIDTPWIATAPMTVTRKLLPAQSMFVLSFAAPSTLTQSLLIDGNTVTLTFSLADTRMVTGSVLLSVLQGSLWLVTCLLTADILL